MDNDLARFDPTTCTHTLVSVGSSATKLNAVTVGAGSLWATDLGTNQLWQIDPIHAVPIRAIPVGQDPLGVAFGAGSVWVANAADGTVSASTRSKANQPQQSASGKRPHPNSRSRTG